MVPVVEKYMKSTVQTYWNSTVVILLLFIYGIHHTLNYIVQVFNSCVNEILFSAYQQLAMYSL